MKIGQLFEHIPCLEKLNWKAGQKIHRITSDSRLITSGDIFVAVRGARMDGHDFLPQAIQAKAAAVVYEQFPDIFLPPHVAGIRVQNSSRCLSDLLNVFHGYPARQMKLVGVTGTNGKTTIAYLLHRLLREKGPAAYLGTLWYELPHQKLTSINTTPGPEVLIPLLADMAKSRVDACVMEVSSHALHQGRVHGLEFELAVFTQLTQDHLDYHKDMEAYYEAKKMLFENHPQPRFKLVNRDCPYGRRIAETVPGVKTLSLKQDADYQITDVETSFAGSRFVLRFRGKQIPFQTRLPFIHNVYNAAEVLAGLDLLGYDLEDFRGMLQEIPGIPGRMERIPGTNGFQVFVDYAHTPDAFENVLSQTRQLNPRKIITVFGCGGDRDRTKRPVMGKIASHYSDVLVLTSDNPRSEDPEMIMKDIMRGIRKKTGTQEFFSMADRQEAIHKAVNLAQSGDVVLILGKGHEDYQIIGESKISFDDRKVVQEYLKKGERVLHS